MNINDMTREEFMALRFRREDELNREFSSMVIIPMNVPLMSIVKYNIREYLSSLFSFIKRPEIYEVSGMHDSGFRCMEFVAVDGQEPLYRMSGCSDVIHLDGIGGYGYNWLNKYGSVPKVIPPSGWNIDCLPTSGLLHIWCNGKLQAGSSYSSFELYKVLSLRDKTA